MLVQEGSIFSVEEIMRRDRRITPRKWRARSGARFSNQDAQIIGEHLEEIAGERGIPYIELSTEQILEDATDPRSPIHGYVFDCDDETAVLLWRRQTVRNMVNHLDIEMLDEVGETIRVKAFHNYEIAPINETEIPERRYGDMECIAENPENRAAIVVDYEGRLRYWAQMVRMLGLEDEFQSVLEAVDRRESTPTIEGIRAAVLESNSEVSRNDEPFKIAVVLVAASYLGTNPRTLTNFTRIHYNTIRSIRRRAMASGVWAREGPRRRHTIETIHEGTIWDDVLAVMEE